MCGKQGCWGPHSSAGFVGGLSEPRMDVLFEEMAGPMPECMEVLSGRADVCCSSG
jgi:hypothetical protein